MTTISKDQIKGFQPGFTYTAPNQPATITHGVTVSSALNSGVFSDLDGNSLINHGRAISQSDGLAGVQMEGDLASVVNALDGTIVGANDGVVFKGVPATLANAGIIRGLDGDGVKFDIPSEATSLTNSGTIYGEFIGVHEFSNFAGGGIHNTGLIDSDGEGIVVDTGEGLRTVIFNGLHGTIRGGADAINVIRGTISLTNLGTLAGDINAVALGDARDVIVNQGRIKGSIAFDIGNDLYKGIGGVAGAVHGGEDDDTLTGGSRADGFFGDTGNDKLSTGAGNDRLHGGFGIDTLTGGVGGDRFFFDTGLNPTFNVDRITDFAVNLDKFVLDDDTFFGIGSIGGLLAAGQFRIGAAAADADDHVIYNANTGFLFYDLDGKGGVGQTHFATIGKHLALDHADFAVIA